MGCEIEVADAVVADEEWAAREADVLADAGFALDPAAVENVVGLDAFPWFACDADREEYEAWLDSVELALSWGEAN